MDFTELVFSTLEQDKHGVRIIKKRFSCYSWEEIKTYFRQVRSSFDDNATELGRKIHTICYFSAIRTACKLGQLETLKQLNTFRPRYHHCRTYIAVYDQPEMAKWIVDTYGESLKMYRLALRESAEHCLAYLESEHPLDPSTLTRIEINSLFHRACNGGLPMIRYLLDKGLTISTFRGPQRVYTETLLREGHDDAIRWLFGKGLIMSDLHCGFESSNL